jgi:16S rRNA processing protein RimM
MRVEVILDDDRVLAPGRPLTLIREGKKENFEIEFSRRQHGRQVLKLRGIESIEEVERRIGGELGIAEEELPPAEDGFFYTFQLKGCVVVTTHSEPLGTVTDVLDSGGTHILKVDGKDGEILIPFAHPILRRVDLGQRRIEVDLPEGLRDLNR